MSSSDDDDDKPNPYAPRTAWGRMPQQPFSIRPASGGRSRARPPRPEAGGGIFGPSPILAGKAPPRPPRKDPPAVEEAGPATPPAPARREARAASPAIGASIVAGGLSAPDWLQRARAHEPSGPAVPPRPRPQPKSAPPIADPRTRPGAAPPPLKTPVRPAAAVTPPEPRPEPPRDAPAEVARPAPAPAPELRAGPPWRPAPRRDLTRLAQGAIGVALLAAAAAVFFFWLRGDGLGLSVGEIAAGPSGREPTAAA
ncbi:MAG: hypothetical protein ACOY4K_00750, partial [Pseudomonadota bacterium]